jgi:uncharacterized protein YcfL
MRTTLAATLLAAALAGCKSNDETARVGGAVDTVVTTRQTQDTAVVTHDTTMKVDVDTNVERGGDVTRVDTVKKTRRTVQPTDSSANR